MFSVHTTSEEFKTQQPPVILDLCLRKTWTGRSRYYQDYIVVEKFRFRNGLENQRPNRRNKAAFQISPRSVDAA